jgi:hypothetical protein
VSGFMHPCVSVGREGGLIGHPRRRHKRSVSLATGPSGCLNERLALNQDHNSLVRCKTFFVHGSLFQSSKNLPGFIDQFNISEGEIKYHFPRTGDNTVNGRDNAVLNVVESSKVHCFPIKCTFLRISIDGI